MAVLATDGPAFEWQVPRAAPTGMSMHIIILATNYYATAIT
jgi:hypothetical protein